MSDQADTAPLPLRVATWNVWWRFGAWGARQPGITQVLRDCGADIIGLQETWPEQVDQLAEALGYHSVCTPARADQEFGFGNAVLSRFPIIDSTVQALCGADGSPGYRSVVRARVQAPTGVVDFYSTHLEAQYDQSLLRSAQLAEVCALVATHREPDTYPPILVGDLNASPDCDEIRRLTGRSVPYVEGLIFSDAWERCSAEAGWTWADNNPNQPTSATWPNRRIDYVLTAWPRPRPAGNAVAVSLIGNRVVQGAVPSDHYGVVADLAGFDKETESD